jgi:hypothetical protein
MRSRDVHQECAAGTKNGTSSAATASWAALSTTVQKERWDKEIGAPETGFRSESNLTPWT